MSKYYNLHKSLTFDEISGYWTLYLEILGAEDVSPRPFLLEKVVLGTGTSTTLSSDIGTDDEQSPQYLRTLLDSDAATQRLISDPTIYNKYTWVQYRSSSFSKQFYTYEKAVESLNSVISILKSNARVYDTPRVSPRLVAINLSSKDKAPSIELLTITKGDTISLQLVNGPTDTTIVTDGEYIPVSRESDSNRRKSNSYVVKIKSNNMSYVGLRDDHTESVYTIPVTMISTSLEGQTSEIIR